MNQYIARPPVGFIEAIKSAFTQYATCNGRSRRSEFWFFSLFNFIINLILIILMVATLKKVETTYGYGYTYEVNPFLNLISWIYSLAVICPTISLAVRRLHDIGKGGAYILMGLIPIAGPIILLVYYCQDSQPELNQYGASPKYYMNQDNTSPVGYQPNPSPLIPNQYNNDVQLNVNPQQGITAQPQPNMGYPPQVTYIPPQQNNMMYPQNNV